jgi:hypothetical protein
MVITNNEDMESKSDRSNCEDMPPLESPLEVSLGYKAYTSASV